MKARAVIGLLFLTGCFSMSNSEKRQNLAHSPSLEQSQKAAVDSGLFTSGNWPDRKWWETFDSDVLNHWVETALSSNPDLRSSEVKIQQAKQMAIVARQPLFPTLYFDAQDNYRYLSENSFDHILNPSLGLPGYQVDLSLAFNYEFDFWNQNRNTFRAALGELKAIEAEFYEAELILSTSVTQAYFALLTTMQKRDLYAELVNIQDRKLKLQEKLLDSALSSAFQPLFDEEALREAKEKLLSMEDEIALQQHLINILMGQSPDCPLALDRIRLEPPKTIPLPDDLSIELLARRPDLMAQIWKAEAAAFEVSVAKADFFPNINLASYMGFTSVAWKSLFDGNSKSFGYKPALSLPIFTAGSIRANLRAKKAKFEEAIYQYNNLLLLSAQQVADSLVQLTTVYEQKSLQEQIVAEAKARLDLTIARVHSGLDSQFAYLDFAAALIERQIRTVEYTYLQYAMLVKLIKSLGGGFSFNHVPIRQEES